MKNMKFYLINMVAWTWCATSACLAAEWLPIEDRKVSFVAEVPGKEKLALFSQAGVWVAKSFGDAKKVLEVQDRDSGKLVGKGLKECNSLRKFLDPYQMRVSFILDITVKEGKARLNFEDIKLETENPQIKFSDNNFRITSKEDIEKLKTDCFSQLFTTFKATLQAPKDDAF